MPDRGRRNRGPAAAAENRRAVLLAARRLFAERGYHVPLSAIAREAGVGQGVLYRHFRSRLDLAFAVFEERFEQLESLAAEADDHAFGRLWRRLVSLIIDEAAMVEMAVDARRIRPDHDGRSRLAGLLSPALDRAQEAGLAPSHLTIDDVMLSVRMVYGVVVTADGASEARRDVDRLVALLPFNDGQEWSHSETGSASHDSER